MYWAGPRNMWSVAATGLERRPTRYPVMASQRYLQTSKWRVPWSAWRRSRPLCKSRESFFSGSKLRISTGLTDQCPVRCRGTGTHSPEKAYMSGTRLSGRVSYRVEILRQFFCRGETVWSERRIATCPGKRLEKTHNRHVSHILESYRENPQEILTICRLLFLQIIIFSHHHRPCPTHARGPSISNQTSSLFKLLFCRFSFNY